MPAEYLIGLLPISLFVTIAYVIKILLDARTRNRLITTSRSDELIRDYLAHQRKYRVVSSVRMGVVLISIAGSFGLIEILGWQIEDRVTFGAIAIVLGMTGIGNLISLFIERKISRDRIADKAPAD